MKGRVQLDRVCILVDVRCKDNCQCQARVAAQLWLLNGISLVRQMLVSIFAVITDFANTSVSSVASLVEYSLNLYLAVDRAPRDGR